MPTLFGANARMRIITMNYAVDNLAAYLIASIVARYASLERMSNRNAIAIVPLLQDTGTPTNTNTTSISIVLACYG